MEILYVLLLLVSAACLAYAAFAHARRRGTADAVTNAAGGCLHDDVKFIALGLLAFVLVPLIQNLDALID